MPYLRSSPIPPQAICSNPDPTLPSPVSEPLSTKDYRRTRQNDDLERVDCDGKDQAARHINASETKSEDGQFIFALIFFSISAQIELSNQLRMMQAQLTEAHKRLSLSQLARWLGEKAEELGVEIYPGFAASKILYDDEKVIGIATNDMGIAKDGSRRDNFQCGVELKVTHNTSW
ncbi:unnamed protein product [Camellia sinensis]